MKITLKKVNEDNLLTIQGEGTAKEDEIIENWYNQIIEHLNKLKLKQQR